MDLSTSGVADIFSQPSPPPKSVNNNFKLCLLDESQLQALVDELKLEAEKDRDDEKAVMDENAVLDALEARFAEELQVKFAQDVEKRRKQLEMAAKSAKEKPAVTVTVVDNLNQPSTSAVRGETPNFTDNSTSGTAAPALTPPAESPIKCDATGDLSQPVAKRYRVLLKKRRSQRNGDADGSGSEVEIDEVVPEHDSDSDNWETDGDDNGFNDAETDTEIRRRGSFQPRRTSKYSKRCCSAIYNFCFIISLI